MAMRRVVVTGLGIVSSIGVGKDAVSQALRQAQSGIVLQPDYVERGFRSRAQGFYRNAGASQQRGGQAFLVFQQGREKVLCIHALVIASNRDSVRRSQSLLRFFREFLYVHSSFLTRKPKHDLGHGKGKPACFAVAAFRAKWYGNLMGIIRSFTSVSILVWGILTLVIGLAAMNITWIMIGLVLSAVGLPFLAGLPMAQKRLYPPAEG